MHKSTESSQSVAPPHNLTGRRDTLSLPTGSPVRSGSTQDRISHHSVHSQNSLGKHDKSMFDVALGANKEGISGVTTDSQTAGEDSTVNRSEDTAHHTTTPVINLCEEVDNDPQPTFCRRASKARFDHIHNLLVTNSDGSNLAVRPSASARYQGHEANDDAFTKIKFSDLNIINPEKLTSRNKLSRSISSIRNQSSVGGLVVRSSHTSHSNIEPSPVQNDMKSEVPRPAGSDHLSPTDRPDERRHSLATTMSSDTDVRSDATGLTSGTLKASTLASKTAARMGGQATFQAVTGLRKWQGKAKKYGVSSLRTFSQDDGHYHYIHKNIEKIAIEMPLPLKKVMIDEAAVILRDTVKGYERVLGSKDPRTTKAREKYEDIQKLSSQMEPL